MKEYICRIALCGQSLFLTAIEAGLATLPGIEVTRFHPHLPGAAERIMALKPDLVMMEQDKGDSDLALVLLNGGLPLVELDTQHQQAMLLTGNSFSISDTTDLIRLIEQIKPKGIDGK
jgi:ABC-type Fe3+-hydroxamate transport system substrate-binding protein